MYVHIPNCFVVARQRCSLALWRWHIDTWTVIRFWCHH